MHSFLVGNNSVHKKAEGANRNVVPTVSHKECKNV